MPNSDTPMRPLTGPNTLSEGWQPLPRTISDWREGHQIGPFRLKRLLGQGGMGMVWLAEQTEPLRRDVAIKVMRHERRVPLEEAHFEIERQALARLSHRAIAQIFEAGQLPDGTLFFAMEYVPGVPLDDFVSDQGPSSAELARLFVEICLGVQHAHQRGLIHRDLKPANLLVQRVEGIALPKIIDFGIATSITPGGGQGSSRVAGTRAYMSPEQRQPDSTGIDARTDVYALGAMLAECLSLSAGVESAVDMDSASLRDALTFSLGRSQPVSDREHAQRLQRLSTQPAELRAIALQAMSEDREQRYASAAAMGEDLTRWLSRHPVHAMGASRWYNFRCLIRRNALVSSATIGAVLGLGVFAIAMSMQASRIALEADRANKALVELREVTDFQTDQLRGISTEKVGQRIADEIRARYRAAQVTSGAATAAIEASDAQLAALLDEVNFTDVARESLDEGIFAHTLVNSRETFADRPAILAELLQSTSMAMRDVGLLKQARPPQDEALALRRQVFGDQHERIAYSLNEAGVLDQYDGKPAEAEARYREATAMYLAVVGEEDPGTLSAMGNLATVLQVQGEKTDEAAQLYERILAVYDKQLVDNPAALTTRVNFAIMKYQAGDYETAEREFRRVLAVYRRSGDELKSLHALNNLSAAMRMQNKIGDAETYLREAIEIGNRVLGAEHQQILSYNVSLSTILVELGRTDEAIAILRSALEVGQRTLGKSHPDVLRNQTILGNQLTKQNKLAEAEPLLRDAYERYTLNFGKERSNTLTAMARLANLLRASGQPAEAVAMLRENEAALRRVSTGASEPDLASALSTLGLALVALDGKQNRADALAAFEESYAIFARVRGEAHSDPRTIAGHLVEFYLAEDAAEPGAGHAAAAEIWRARRDIE